MLAEKEAQLRAAQVGELFAEAGIVITDEEKAAIETADFGLGLSVVHGAVTDMA